MENKKSKSKKKKVSVYLGLDLLKEIDEYKKRKGYGSRSELFRMTFRTHKQIFPLQSPGSERVSLEDRLKSIEKRLDEIKMESKIIENQESVNNNIEKRLEIRELEAHSKINNISFSDIPDFKNISEILLNLIHESKGIKDFVLMEHMRLLGYSEATIWLILYKLEGIGKIDLRDGAWKLA